MKPRHCLDVLANGGDVSGVYYIDTPGENPQTIQVYCDQETDGGGWMVSTCDRLNILGRMEILGMSFHKMFQYEERGLYWNHFIVYKTKDTCSNKVLQPSEI